MMHILLIVFALVCFVLSTWHANTMEQKLVSAGLAFLAAAMLPMPW